MLANAVARAAARRLLSAGRASERSSSRSVSTSAALNARVFSFGDGSSGALGLGVGELRDSYEPEEVPGLPDDIRFVAAGLYHSLAVSATGSLWAWGRNFEGQLGRGTGFGQFDPSWCVPERVKGLDDVKVVAAAASGVMSVAIGADGSVWTWGRSKRGQLGLGNGIVEAELPDRVRALEGTQIEDVSCGWGHVLARSTVGEVFAWGFGKDGRLGLDVDPSNVPMTNVSKDSSAPKPEMEAEQMPIAWEAHIVPAFAELQCRAIDITCGMDHSVVAAEDGSCSTFGNNELGQLGRPGGNLPERIPDSFGGSAVDWISAGLGHTLVLTRAPRVYSWGWNLAGQLGKKDASGSVLEVKALRDLGVFAVSAGRVHSAAITEDGRLYTWGSGANGRLGLGTSLDAPEPTPVEALIDHKLQYLACGSDHTLALVE
eukprot:jgi/Chlat1/2193/Chrsp17S02762